MHLSETESVHPQKAETFQPQAPLSIDQSTYQSSVYNL